VKKKDSFVVDFIENLTRRNVNLGNPFIILLLLLGPSVITILTYNLANRLLPDTSDFSYYSQSTIISSLMFILFIVIISLFNLISGNKIVRNVQFRLIFVVSVASFLWQAFTFDYLAALLKPELMTGYLQDFDRMGSTWNRLIVSFLVLVLPFITLGVNYFVCFVNPKFSLNFEWFKRINSLQIFGLIVLVFLSLSLFDLPRWSFILVSALGFIFLLENRNFGNRFVAVAFGVIIFNLFYRVETGPEIKDISSLPFYLRPFVTTMGRLLKTDNQSGQGYVFIWDYLIYFGYFALIIYLFFYFINSNTILDTIYSTLGLLSILYFDFITNYFVTRISDISNPLEFISSNDYLSEFSNGYSYDIQYVLLFFVLGIIYLIRLAYLSIPKIKSDTKYSTLALASFLIAPFGLITTGAANLASIVLAHLARSEMQRSNGNLRGSGLTVFALSFFYIVVAFFPIFTGIFD
jgi:hypothetical protein